MNIYNQGTMNMAVLNKFMGHPNFQKRSISTMQVQEEAEVMII